jgi:hypothetical protein
VKANDHQVGGAHYKHHFFQPWDWDRYGVGYLECNVIKYITRWRNKNGLEDLKKARHYVLKLIEENRVHGRTNRVASIKLIPYELCDDYQRSWKLDTTECAIFQSMIRWQNQTLLHQCVGWIQELIDGNPASNVRTTNEVDSEPTVEPVAPVEPGEPNIS